MSMDFDDIISRWKSVEKARSALGLKTRQTLYNWRDNGIPRGWQARIQIMTRGKLRAEINGKDKSIA